MRMSCNGCRVLRKGCSKDCTIRPCLQWLKNPQHQSNATFFLAKFYGRAGLINLINSGPENLRPAIFRSLLYEACGRIVDPVYGSAGLICSGSWQLCQAAVEAVLKGAPIPQISPEEGRPTMMNGCDIRHVARDDQSDAVHRVKPRGRFQRQFTPNQTLDSAVEFGWFRSGAVDTDAGLETEDYRTDSMPQLSGGQRDGSRAEELELELELRLGTEPVTHASGVHGVRHVKGVRKMDGWGDATCNAELGLVWPA